MHFYFLKFIPLIIYSFLFIFSNANFSTVDDDAFVAFVQGPANFEHFLAGKAVKIEQNKKMLAQIYDSYLGILYAMRKDWNCNNLKMKFDGSFTKDVCVQYRKYLDILYEYLYHVHAGHSVTRPTFIENAALSRYNRDLIEFLISLSTISKFYLFDSEFALSSLTNREEIKIFRKFELENENCLEYHHDLAYNEKEFNKKKRQKIDSESRTKFELLMEKHFNKLWENAKLKNGNKNSERMSISLEKTMPSDYAVHIYDTFLGMPIYSFYTLMEDEALINFVKTGGSKMTNIEIDEDIEDFYEAVEMHLGLLLLMRNNWDCANAKVANAENECQKLRYFVDIFYQYLFREWCGIAVVKPMLQTNNDFEIKPVILSVEDILSSLNQISMYFFGANSSADKDKFAHLLGELASYKLLNKHELDYNGTPVSASASSSTAGNASNSQEFLIRKFDEELDALLEKWRKIPVSGLENSPFFNKH